MTEETIVIPVQVNGKLRDRIEVAAGAGEEVIIKLALSSSGVQRQIEGKQVVKAIYAAGRLLNIVVK